MHILRHASRAAASPAARGAAAGLRQRSCAPASAAPIARHGRSPATAAAPRRRAAATTTARALPPSSLTPPPVPALAAQPWLGTPEQLAALDELRERFSSSSSGSPPPADELLRWYLRDRYFSVDDAERKLRSMLEWRARYATLGEGSSSGALWAPLGLPGVAGGDVSAELATGKAYVHEGPDAAGRPVLVVVARKHLIGEYPLEDSKRMCMHLLDEVVSRLPPTADARGPGDEQLLGVFDLKGFELKNADLAFVAFLVEAFFEYYPRRVGQVLLVDAPWIFQAPWRAIKPLLRKYSALVRFVDRDTLVGEFFTGSNGGGGSDDKAPLTPPRDFV